MFGLSRRKVRSMDSRSGASKPWFKQPLLWVLIVSVFTVSLIVFSSGDNAIYDMGYDKYISFTAFDPTANAQQMQDWRADVDQSCKTMLETNNKKDSPSMRQQKEQLEREALSKIHFPSYVSGSVPSDHQVYQHCRNVFIDLGTNIGDSIGYFVDSSLDVCTSSWLDALPKTKLNQDFPRPHLDVKSLEIIHKGVGSNPLYGMIQQHLRETSLPISPSSFCVYGMEGNPEFTERLQKLENHIMQTQPRPVQHLHIHTESVITAVDGPTKLYLDKTSVEQNFWGSSILSSQQDAVKSAKELGDGNVFSADVQGITLSNLFKQTALAYKPGATPDEQTGGLIIVKIDVEGAEYQVLKEAAATGVLCDLAKKGNRIVMIVEYHHNSITDPAERRREKAGADEARKTLEECGVKFGTLHAFWA